MATVSFYRTITLRNQQETEEFVNVLERASKKESKHVNCVAEEVSGKRLREIFKVAK